VAEAKAEFREFIGLAKALSVRCGEPHKPLDLSPAQQGEPLECSAGGGHWVAVPQILPDLSPAQQGEPLECSKGVGLAVFGSLLASSPAHQGEPLECSQAEGEAERFGAGADLPPVAPPSLEDALSGGILAADLEEFRSSLFYPEIGVNAAASRLFPLCPKFPPGNLNITGCLTQLEPTALPGVEPVGEVPNYFLTTDVDATIEAIFDLCSAGDFVADSVCGIAPKVEALPAHQTIALDVLDPEVCRMRRYCFRRSVASELPSGECGLPEAYRMKRYIFKCTRSPLWDGLPTVEPGAECKQQ